MESKSEPVSEPAALDLAATLREEHRLVYETDDETGGMIPCCLCGDDDSCAFLRILDELERCRAERDALRAALKDLVESCDPGPEKAGRHIPTAPNSLVYRAARAALER